MANLEVLALDEATPQIRAPGSGDGYTMPRPVAINPGTLTTDIKILDLAATWNNSGVAFSGVILNVTDTASAVGSLLVDFKVGNTTQAKLLKNGSFKCLAAFFGSIDNAAFRANSSGLALGSSASVGWSSNASVESGAAETTIYRDAAYTLGQRNGTNAQTNRLYRTYTDASNYQRLTNTWSTSTAVIHNEGAGTGADGSVAFNDAALATDATKGFVMIPSCAGTPTGTPADIPTGQVPIVFDSTNNKLYVYDGGWLATAALT